MTKYAKDKIAKTATILMEVERNHKQQEELIAMKCIDRKKKEKWRSRWEKERASPEAQAKVRARMSQSRSPQARAYSARMSFREECQETFQQVEGDKTTIEEKWVGSGSPKEAWNASKFSSTTDDVQRACKILKMCMKRDDASALPEEVTDLAFETMTEMREWLHRDRKAGLV